MKKIRNIQLVFVFLEAYVLYCRDIAKTQFPKSAILQLSIYFSSRLEFIQYTDLPKSKK